MSIDPGPEHRTMRRGDRPTDPVLSRRAGAFGGIILVLVGMLVLLAACADAAPSAPTPVTIQLKWLHQAQFAGFYAADQRGLYEAAGLDVTIQEGGPTVDKIEAVLNGEIAFGITAPESILAARAAGKPVQAIAVIYQRNPVVFLSLQESGIQSPQQFDGRRLWVPPDLLPTLNALISRFDLDRDRITLVEDIPGIGSGLDLSPFYDREFDILGGYMLNQGVRAQLDGYDLITIHPDNFGIHLFGDTIFTTEAIIQEQPEVVQAFLDATLSGWVWAVENSDQAAELVLAYEPEQDLATQNVFMAASIPYIQYGQDPIGWMTEDAWQQVQEIFVQFGGLTAEEQLVDRAFTMQFLQNAYPNFAP